MPLTMDIAHPYFRIEVSVLPPASCPRPTNTWKQDFFWKLFPESNFTSLSCDVSLLPSVKPSLQSFSQSLHLPWCVQGTVVSFQLRWQQYPQWHNAKKELPQCVTRTAIWSWFQYHWQTFYKHGRCKGKQSICYHSFCRDQSISCNLGNKCFLRLFFCSSRTRQMSFSL